MGRQQEIFLRFGVRVEAEAGAGGRRAGWDAASLEQVYAALEHFAPILGGRRVESARDRADQEVTAVRLTASGPAPSRAAVAGVQADDGATSRVEVPAAVREDEEFGPPAVGWYLTRALAVRLLDYALPAFVHRFYGGADALVGAVGAGASREDFLATLELHLARPDALRGQSPRRARAVEDLLGRLPGERGPRPGETVREAAERIARDLESELPGFAAQVGPWSADGHRLLQGETPPSAYGLGSVERDFAESAMFYFHDAPYLRERSAQRAEFFDGLVAGWTGTQARGTARELTTTVTAPQAEAPERGTLALALSSPEMTGLYQALYDRAGVSPDSPAAARIREWARGLLRYAAPRYAQQFTNRPDPSAGPALSSTDAARDLAGTAASFVAGPQALRNSAPDKAAYWEATVTSYLRNRPHTLEDARVLNAVAGQLVRGTMPGTQSTAPGHVSAQTPTALPDAEPPGTGQVKRTTALDAGAVRSFQRLWAKAPVEPASTSPAHRALRRAHTLLGGTPAGTGAVIRRFTVHAGDFTALSQTDQHVAAVAYVVMRGSAEQVESAVTRARAA
ncbi:hypothetical protein, partial [Streptomyces violaceorubidus]|uniref:hypothetical protein n=1 Tax=Streptomyces violaceorubidus TaxID=284042 RepID=UPI001AE07B74